MLDGVEESKGKDTALVVDDYENMFQGGVALETCDEELAERVSVTGNYDENECGLQMTGMVEEDGGIWECEVAGNIRSDNCWISCISDGGIQVW